MSVIGRARRWWHWGSCSIKVKCGGEQHFVRPVDLENVVLLNHNAEDAIVIALGAPRSACHQVAGAWRNVSSQGVRSGIGTIRDAVDGRDAHFRSEWRVARIPMKTLESGGYSPWRSEWLDASEDEAAQAMRPAPLLRPGQQDDRPRYWAISRRRSSTSRAHAVALFIPGGQDAYEPGYFDAGGYRFTQVIYDKAEPTQVFTKSGAPWPGSETVDVRATKARQFSAHWADTEERACVTHWTEPFGDRFVMYNLAGPLSSCGRTAASVALINRLEAAPTA